MQVPEVGVVEVQLGVVDEYLVAGVVVEEVVVAEIVLVRKATFTQDGF